MVQPESSDDIVFELMPEDRADYDVAESPVRSPANTDRAAGIRLTVGALLFGSLLLFTFVVANFQNRSERPPAAAEETRNSLEEVEAVKQDIESDAAPEQVREEPQSRERELQEALDAAREELEVLKAAAESAEDKVGAGGDEDQLVQQRLEAEKERRDQAQREAELEELLELEMAREE